MSQKKPKKKEETLTDEELDELIVRALTTSLKPQGEGEKNGMKYRSFLHIDLECNIIRDEELRLFWLEVILPNGCFMPQGKTNPMVLPCGFTWKEAELAADTVMHQYFPPRKASGPSSEILENIKQKVGQMFPDATVTLINPEDLPG